jgi:hypothetical protein
LSANNHRFPEVEWNWKGADDAYEAEAVRLWFKRCIEDYPVISMYVEEEYYENKYHEILKWFNKWFSQFRSNENV